MNKSKKRRRRRRKGGKRKERKFEAVLGPMRKLAERGALFFRLWRVSLHSSQRGNVTFSQKVSFRLGREPGDHRLHAHAPPTEPPRPTCLPHGAEEKTAQQWQQPLGCRTMAAARRGGGGAEAAAVCCCSSAAPSADVHHVGRICDTGTRVLLNAFVEGLQVRRRLDV